MLSLVITTIKSITTIKTPATIAAVTLTVVGVVGLVTGNANALQRSQEATALIAT